MMALVTDATRGRESSLLSSSSSSSSFFDRVPHFFKDSLKKGAHFFFSLFLGKTFGLLEDILLSGKKIYDGEERKQQQPRGAMKEERKSSSDPSTKAAATSSSSSRGETEAAGGVFSVIVSCANERENISKCIASACATPRKNTPPAFSKNKTLTRRRRTRVVIVDGGSTDGTVDEARKWAAAANANASVKVVVKNEERGRAKQFNRGGMESVSKRGGGDCCFERARGDEHILVFLHADTTMPETYRDDIFDALRKERERRERERLFPSAWGVIKNGCSKLARRGNAKTDDAKTEVLPCWGAFPIKLSGERSKWRKSVVASLANFRTRRTSIPYGDQAIFVTASAFAKHKFDESKTFMEDYDYSLRLKKAFGKPALVSGKSPVTTDSRRFERVGFMNTTIINILCVVGYHLNVDAETLAKFYRNADKKDDR